MGTNMSADEIFFNLSEETFSAVLKFMRLSPEQREQVLELADELTENEE